jgi:hypothetical protein
MLRRGQLTQHLGSLIMKTFLSEEQGEKTNFVTSLNPAASQAVSQELER